MRRSTNRRSSSRIDPLQVPRPREGLFQEEKDLAAAYRRLLRAGFKTGEIIRTPAASAKDPGLLDTPEPPKETLTERG